MTTTLTGEHEADMYARVFEEAWNSKLAELQADGFMGRTEVLELVEHYAHREADRAVLREERLR